MSKLNELPNPPVGQVGWPWTEETDPNIYSKKQIWPKISIITPSYNQGQFIEETIRSILLQNYPNLEYLIIDGNSNDNTIEIIKKYDPWISYWTSERDFGQVDAINKGLKKCTGLLFNWINSDDLIEKDGLFNIACNYEGSDVISGKTIIIQDNKKIGEIKLNYSPFITFNLTEKGYNQPGTFFKLEIIREIELNPELNYSFDLDFWKRYLLRSQNGDVKIISSPVSIFRLHECSKTQIESNSSQSSFEEENEKCLASYFKVLPKRKREFLFRYFDAFFSNKAVAANTKANYFINKKDILWVFKKCANYSIYTSIKSINLRLLFKTIAAYLG
jgi:glycosyltransferase involved in cell wall biosynthesis